jgi:hypothetical protein
MKIARDALRRCGGFEREEKLGGANLLIMGYVIYEEYKNIPSLTTTRTS